MIWNRDEHPARMRGYRLVFARSTGQTPAMNRTGLYRPMSNVRSSLVGAVVARLTRKAKVGDLMIALPSGERFRCAGSEPGPAADIRFLKWRAMARLVFGGDV